MSDPMVGYEIGKREEAWRTKVEVLAGKGGRYSSLKKSWLMGWVGVYARAVASDLERTGCAKGESTASCGCMRVLGR